MSVEVMAGVLERTLQSSQIQDHDDQMPPGGCQFLHPLTKDKFTPRDAWGPADRLRHSRML